MGDVRIGDEDDMGGQGGLGIGLPQSRVGEATRGERVEELRVLSVPNKLAIDRAWHCPATFAPQTHAHGRPTCLGLQADWQISEGNLRWPWVPWRHRAWQKFRGVEH